MIETNRDTFCSELSREMGESMVGTAPMVDVWLLLEYNGVWRAKATDDNELPQLVKDWLNKQLATTNNARVQFIRRNRIGDAAGISFFIALTTEVEPRLYQLHLKSYEELFSLNVPAILSGDSNYDEYIWAGPLYLVCTNGKRDRCCARFGATLFQAMVERVGDSVWQCTHLGGHRFAPTVVTFPDGAYYGHLTPAELEPFVESQERGAIYLNNLRGRCCYDKVTQAAAHYLRQKTGILQQAGLRFFDQEQLNEDLWAVTFAEKGSGEMHRAVLMKEMSAADQVVSCSPLKAKPVSQFRQIV
jgi:hypothetical protein